VGSILLILIVTSVALAIPGVFLTINRMAMVADALSHTVLLGIVVAFMITGDRSSPWLMIGAALFGLLTVYLIDRVNARARIKSDAATGIVFPLFFSLGVLLMSRFLPQSQLNVDTVIMGDVIFAPFNRVDIFGVSLPRALVTMALVLILNALFVALFYKELKLSSFDGEYAQLIGLQSGWLAQGFVFLVSLSAVTAFEVVGAILVIAFLVIPAATALLLTKRLRSTLVLTALIAVFNSVAGFGLALWWNVSLAGMCAATAGVVFMLVFLFHGRGVVARAMQRRAHLRRYRRELFLTHVFNHRESDEAIYELGFDSISDHIGWSKRRVGAVADGLIEDGYLLRDESHGMYDLTDAGMEHCRAIRERHCLMH
jgi:ABC-type Mn2+/Zn2+ transport system permease subunit